MVSKVGHGSLTQAHAAAARPEDSRHPVGRHRGAGERQGDDRRGGRPPALADLERQGKDAKITLERTEHVMPVFQGERRPEEGSAVTPAVEGTARDRPLSVQPERLAGQLCRTSSCRLRVGTSITEGTANFLVNRRMNKSQQMRWSRRGADLLLQVRCAVLTASSAPAWDSSSKPKPILSPKWPWLPDPQSFDGPLRLDTRPALIDQRPQHRPLLVIQDNKSALLSHSREIGTVIKP